MKICYRKSGGFAGLVKGVDLDTDALPPAEAETLRQLVRAAAFFQQPARSAPRLPDVEQVMVEVTDEDRTHQVLVQHGQGHTELEPLLRYLESKAQYLKR